MNNMTNTKEVLVITTRRFTQHRFLEYKGAIAFDSPFGGTGDGNYAVLEDRLRDKQYDAILVDAYPWPTCRQPSERVIDQELVYSVLQYAPFDGRPSPGQDIVWDIKEGKYDTLNQSTPIFNMSERAVLCGTSGSIDPGDVQRTASVLEEIFQR
jgi:hypothetical protein